MVRLKLVALVAVMLLGSAGARMQDAESRVYPLAEAPADFGLAIQRANMVIISLQGAVLSELTRELNRGGPAGAMRSCHLDATAIAQRVGREEGLAVGRTSDRLRNPLNAPRPWAAAIVRQYAGRRAAEVDGFAVDLGDKVGVMRPIAQRRMCNSCHGPADTLSPGVRADLKDRYPADRATGYAEGDIRGWFWVEVPKKR